MDPPFIAVKIIPKRLTYQMLVHSRVAIYLLLIVKIQFNETVIRLFGRRFEWHGLWKNELKIFIGHIAASNSFSTKTIICKVLPLYVVRCEYYCKIICLVMMNIDIWCFLWHFLIYPTQIKWMKTIESNRERERRTHNCFRIICLSNKIHFLHSQMNLMAANICLRGFATWFFPENYFLIVEKKTFLISCILYRRIPCA